MADVHVVEIPTTADNDDSKQLQVAGANPLSEIATSPGHLLLLKLLQREEDLAAARAAARESRLDSLKREAFQLSALFFAFHGVALTLIFAASARRQDDHAVCYNWWIPAGLSFGTSLAIVTAVQNRVCAYWRTAARLQREKGDLRSLARLAQELRLKGASYDLSKEPMTWSTAKRMKSSSVEVKWRGIKWISRNFVTACLLCFAGLAIGACKLILCG